MKYAAIDIGSNAIRLLIANIVKNNKGVISHKKISLVRVPIRLGEDVFRTQLISDKSEKRLAHAMRGFYHLMKVHGIKYYRACATSAFREAKNGAQIIEKVFKKSDIKIDLISGDEEAKIIYSTHIEKLLSLNQNILYVDVGGGSTELSLFTEMSLQASKSFPIGTVRLLQDNVNPLIWDDLAQWLTTHTKDVSIEYIVGSGGNINKLVKMSNEKNNLRTPEITLPDLEQLHTNLSTYTYEERISELNLNPDRADVILPACEIFLKILHAASIPKVYVPKIGLADGVIIEMYSNKQFLKRIL